MDVEDIKDTLIQQKAKLDASGVDRVLHRNPAGKRLEYDAGYFYGYYDAIVTFIDAIKEAQNGEVNQSNVDSKI